MIFPEGARRLFFRPKKLQHAGEESSPLAERLVILGNAPRMYGETGTLHDCNQLHYTSGFRAYALPYSHYTFKV